MSAPVSRDPLVVNTQDGSCWVRRAVTQDGRGLYALEGTPRCCPEYVLTSLKELAEIGLRSMADALPMPTGPQPQADADRAKAPWGRLDLIAKLRAQVAELRAERHVTNKALSDAAEALRENRSRIAELERPAVERHRREVRESYRWLAAHAREGGDFEGEAVVVQQLAEREALWAQEDALAKEFAADPLAVKPWTPGPSAEASADKLTRLLAPTPALREEATDGPPLTVFRASHDAIVMGLYTTREAAREHCQAEERLSWPTGTTLSFTWVPDDSDPLSPEELSVFAGQNEESVTGYVVTPLEVAAAYDEGADE